VYRKSKFQSPLKIALVGTRGVPARYGGFETCVEEVGRRLVARGHEVVVYCRAQENSVRTEKEYLGMQLVHLPAPRKRTLETICHTGLSVGHILSHSVDAAIVFNAANSPWLPLLRLARIPVATHVDGLEWKRAKWGRWGRKYYRFAESMAVRWSDSLIADAVGIQDYYRTEFDASCELITYGAPLLDSGESRRLAELNLEPGNYDLVVARFEPENHVDLIVGGFVSSSTQRPLVVVGSAPYAKRHTREIHSMGDKRVQFLGGVWDQELLDQLYANARIYWHGHSVGGTNPSLLRAIGAGAATNAFDVTFNREVLGDSGRYFSTQAEVSELIAHADATPGDILKRGQAAMKIARQYDWDSVADGYEKLSYKLANHTVRRSGHRRRAADRTSQSALVRAAVTSWLP
jgi:glycosyltransferase involved in cell wall biosynthesis